MKSLKVSFGIIVCNGEDYIYECVKNIYPYAHSICIAEGATENWCEALKWATPRSTDNTINLLNQLKAEDVENKIRIVYQLEPYKNKNEQCNYYMKMVPEDTDYIWVVDDDEFYLQEDIEKMFGILSLHKYSMVRMEMFHFWKNYNTIRVGNPEQSINRIWKYEPNYFFSDHRPMTILNKDGVDLKDIKLLDGSNHDIICRHYSFINEKRVYEKMLYYTKTFIGAKDYIGKWFFPVWESWTNENKKMIEKQYSLHPTEPNGVSKSFTLKHPDIIKNKINQLK